MRVLVFIRQRSFARYVMIDLALAARRIGWDVQWLDLERLLLETANASEDEKRSTIVAMRASVDRFNADVVFSYGLEYLERSLTSYLPWPACSLRELFRRPCVYFFFDFGFPFDGPLERSDAAFYLTELKAPSSLVFCWDRRALEVLTEVGVENAVYFPMAANEEMFYPARVGGEDDAIPILFVGGPTPERVCALEGVADLGLSIYGYDPERWRNSPGLAACFHGEALGRDQLRALYQRATIAVNITRPHGVSSLNMRVYEAMASGCLVLTDGRSDAGTLFEEGREIVVYDSVADLRRKATFFLEHAKPNERRSPVRACSGSGRTTRMRPGSARVKRGSAGSCRSSGSNRTRWASGRSHRNPEGRLSLTVRRSEQHRDRTRSASVPILAPTWHTRSEVAEVTLILGAGRHRCSSPSSLASRTTQRAV